MYAVSTTGTASKGICPEVGDQHRRSVLRNLRKAVLAGSVLLPSTGSANLVDSVSIHDDYGTLQLGFDAKVRHLLCEGLSPASDEGCIITELAASNEELGRRERYMYRIAV